MIRFLSKWLRQARKGKGGFEIFHGGNPSALNVIVVTEHINATYFISFDIPLRSLHKEGKVNFAVVSQEHIGTSVRWMQSSSCFHPDVVVMTRYGEIRGREILDGFRRRGIPVIYHIDDDLLEVPESLGLEIRKRQGAEDVVNTRRYLLQHCDLIYASTRTLAELMQQRFPSQTVVHGIYAPYLGDVLKPSAPRPGPVIGYMGSKGHQHDLDLVVPTLERLLTERPELEFEVFGTIRMPPVLERFGSRVRSHTVQKSYGDFLATLANLGWSIGLAPLQDEPFNHCKAPTKFIEYTACGIAVAASHTPAYNEAMPKNGGWLVTRDWYSTLVYMLDHPRARQDAVSNAQHHCAVEYNSEVLKNQVVCFAHAAIGKERNDPFGN